eukprot:7377453-Prymnesium_polylepis.2
MATFPGATQRCTLSRGQLRGCARGRGSTCALSLSEDKKAASGHAPSTMAKSDISDIGTELQHPRTTASRRSCSTSAAAAAKPGKGVRNLRSTQAPDQRVRGG